MLNALKVTGKKIDEVKLVTSGAGAAALACLGLLVKLGVPRENIWVTDLAGVVYEGRTELMDEDKVVYAQKTAQRTLAEVIDGRRHLPRPVGRRRAQAGDGRDDGARSPVIFALANPTPEILPEEVKAVRNDAIIATGRTDYPNQVNNVLCFPVHLPRRARLGRDDDHDRDGDRRGARDRRAGAGRAERGRRPRPTPARPSASAPST